MNVGRPRRILYVDLASAVGGSVVSLYHLVAGLDRSLYQPAIVLHAGNTDAERFRALGIPVSIIGRPGVASSAPVAGSWSGVRQSGITRWLKRLPMGERLVHLVGFWLRVFPGVLRDARIIAKIIRQQQPDLVHLNDVIAVTRPGALAARIAGVPALCHLRAFSSRNHFDRWLSRGLVGYICISNAIDAHQRHLGGRVGPSWVVHNGTDLADYTDPGDPATLRAEWGVLPGQQLVGCVGRLVPWKGQRDFIEAVALLAPDRPGLRALVVGSPTPGAESYAQALRELVVARGLTERILFAGFRRDIAPVLASLDVMVHASSEPEPFGRVIIESMAAGTATIATDAGAVPEIIADGVTGLLVPPANPSAMAAAMARLLDDPALRERLAAAGRRDVATRFSVECYVDGVQQVYAKVMA